MRAHARTAPHPRERILAGLTTREKYDVAMKTVTSGGLSPHIWLRHTLIRDTCVNDTVSTSFCLTVHTHHATNPSRHVSLADVLALNASSGNCTLGCTMLRAAAKP